MVDDDEVRRFIERFALVLAGSGMPRMAARVFACIHVDDDARMTAGEIAARLDVSPAAVSGAVRSLLDMTMITREREPGARSDHYRLFDDVWVEVYGGRIEQMSTWEKVAAEGAELLGTDSAAGRRMQETQAFFAFVRDEVPVLMERWRAHRDSLFGSDVRQ